MMWISFLGFQRHSQKQDLSMSKLQPSSWRKRHFHMDLEWMGEQFICPFKTQELLISRAHRSFQTLLYQADQEERYISMYPVLNQDRLKSQNPQYFPITEHIKEEQLCSLFHLFQCKFLPTRRLLQIIMQVIKGTRYLSSSIKVVLLLPVALIWELYHLALQILRKFNFKSDLCGLQGNFRYLKILLLYLRSQ